MAGNAHHIFRRRPDADETRPAPLAQPPAPAAGARDPLALASLAGAAPSTRANVLATLQRSAGNRSVAAALAREPAPEAPAAEMPAPVPAATAGSPGWEVSLKPGTRAPDRPRGLGEGATVFRGDTITFRARFPGMSPDGQEFTQVTLTDGSETGPVDGVWEDDETFVVNVVVNTVGSRSLVCEATSQGESLGSHDVQLTSVMDVGDWSTRLTAASTLMVGEFGDALAAITLASKAWEQAHAQHDKVLADALAQERLVKDLLLAAFLATLAGGAGGALAGYLKNTSLKPLNDEKTMVGDVLATAISDACKDGLKYAIRTIPKVGGVAGSTPEVAGDSLAPPVGGGAAPPPTGGYVGEFLADLLGQLGHEVGILAREIGRMQIAASDAMAVGSTAEFDEDPLGIFTGDTSLDLLTRGLHSDWTKYLDGLWTGWLSNHSYELTVSHIHSDMPFVDDECVIALKSNVSWPLHRYLEAEAATCGTTLDAWLAKYAAPLKAQLEAERDRINAGGEPAPEEATPQ